MSGKYQLKKRCQYCNEPFIGFKLSKYCCKAHKQAAYRERKNPPMIRAINQTDRYHRMVLTKASRIKTVTCVECGCEFSVTHLQGTNKLYHNNTCKQRAYRQRVKERNAVRDNQSGNR